MKARGKDDRVTVLTPPGRGAIAVVAAMGDAALRTIGDNFCAASGRPLDEQEMNRIAFGYWTSGQHREDVVLVRTAVNAWEIHCHGGAVASQRIVAALQAGGCEVQSWQDWLAGEERDQIALEADLALARAATRRTAAILLDQREGALRRAIAAIEADIAAGALSAAQRQLDELLARVPLGRRLTEPWLVAIAGPPNVGKSSLINALVGYERAIVYHQAGTTRDVLTADAAIDGWPVRLIDAAGIRATLDPLEAEGVARARQQIARADLVLWISDATAPDDPADRSFAFELERLSAGAVIRVVNKIDLAPTSAAAGDVRLSARTGEGLDRLLELAARRLVPNPPPPGAAVPFTARQACMLEGLRQGLGRGAAPAAR